MDLHPELTAISVCTGGGGLDLGLELAMPGFRPVVMVEREAFACAHLVAAMEAGVMAPAAVWSDARTFDGRQCRGAVDGVVGGIPCQPHSLAGRRLGRHDPRDLWSDFRRIFVQSGAWWCLVENVRGMLTAGRDEIAGAERVRRDLFRLGCDVEGGLFTAAETGAPHERARLFILGVADARCGGISGRRDAGDVSGPASATEGAEAERQRDGDSAGYGGADVAYGDVAGLEGRRHADGERSGKRPARPGGRELGGAASTRSQVGRRRSRPGEWLDADRCGGQLEHAARLGRREGRAEPELRGGRGTADGAGGQLGDADVAFVRRVAPAGEQPQSERDEGTGGRSPFPPRPGDVYGWRGVADDAPECLPALSRYDRFRIALGEARAGVVFPPGGTEDVEAGALRPPGLPAPVEPDLRRMAHELATRMDDACAWGRTDRLRMLGNGVVPLAAAHAFRTLATRLAARGSAGAAELVRMMEAGQ